jgi:hypothetical protein
MLFTAKCDYAVMFISYKTYSQVFHNSAWFSAYRLFLFTKCSATLRCLRLMSLANSSRTIFLIDRANE